MAKNMSGAHNTMLPYQSKQSHSWYVENGRRAGSMGKGCKHSRDKVEACQNARNAARARWDRVRIASTEAIGAAVLGVMAYIMAVMMFSC